MIRTLTAPGQSRCAPNDAKSRKLLPVVVIDHLAPHMI